MYEKGKEGKRGGERREEEERGGERGRVGERRRVGKRRRGRWRWKMSRHRTDCTPQTIKEWSLGMRSSAIPRLFSPSNKNW